MKTFLPIFLLAFVLFSCISAKKRSDILNNANNPSNPNNTNTQAPVITEIISRKMTCSYRVLEDDDSLRIFLEMDIPRLAEKDGKNALLQEFALNYGILANYTSKDFIDKRKVSFNSPIVKKNKLYYTSFSVEKRPIISAVLILEILDSKQNQKLLEDIPLTYTITKIREKYGIFDKSGEIPFFSNYLLTKDTIQIRNIGSSTHSMIVRHFKHNFEPASPPMNLTSKSIAKDLKIDSMFTISSHQNLHFTKPGLYLVQLDTSSYYGLSFYVAERKYPKLSKVDDLFEPLIYITTEEEMNQFKQAPSAQMKKEMDKFWLKLMSGNVKTAKFTIREYYRRVKEANRLFTSYKEGWKTDMGMIYIVYGGPNRVIRTNDAEYWFYTQNSNFSEIKFSFARKPNQFVDDYYSLLRFPEYEQVWYPLIELWREGKIQ